ncbi:unnamed protein product [Mortierella alpina]
MAHWARKTAFLNTASCLQVVLAHHSPACFIRFLYPARLMNVLIPGFVKIKSSKMPFVQMENISKFLDGCERLGCPRHDLFQTIDLYENKNPGQVVDAIWSLSRHAAKAGCDTPILGPKLSDKHEVEFSEEVLNAGKTVINTYQYGYSGGANQSGVRTGRREIGGVDPGRTQSPSGRF